MMNRMSVKEFRELGLLQELNRRFLHPMGLALEVEIHTDTGEESFSGIWDYRDDPVGLIFAEGTLRPEVAISVSNMLKSKLKARRKSLGWFIQPTN